MTNDTLQPRAPWVSGAQDLYTIDTEVNGKPVSGFIAPGWESLLEVFADNFRRDELGAAVSIVHRGHKVVDLWGGHIAPQGEPWSADTLVLFFSCSKILTTLSVHHLIGRGVLELDMPLIDVWPELLAAQQGATLRMALEHSLGLPALSRPLKVGAYDDHAYMADQLAQQTPFWTPGERVGYHPITFGFVLGEIVRRVAGQSVGRYFEQYFAGPLKLDLFIGLDPALFPRTAPVRRADLIPGEPLRPVAAASQEIGSIQNLWLFNNGQWRGKHINSPEGLRHEIPAANGVGNARALAALCAVLVDEDKAAKEGLNKAALAALQSVRSATEKDATLLCPTRFSSGLMLSMDNRHLPGADYFVMGRQAFGHVGAGGSFALADPEANLAMGYVMNQQGAGVLLNERGQNLIDATYDQLGFSGVHAGAWQP